ncbi:MAG TPA: GNAT family N-acetyltransferase [Ignavibacteriaceae bacterium]|nr:GNAT family N-acetyltransferase [Ignavibacteriaceae bacterium]
MSAAKSNFKFNPLTYERWGDLKKLFGEKGACGGCWCMWWRISRKDFETKKGEGNFTALKRLVKGNSQTGIIAYDEKKPVGWIAFAPREHYFKLETSKILKPVDDKPVWSVTCFFINKDYRRKGLTIELLKEAEKFTRKNGGRILEGYPIDPKTKNYAPVFANTGLASAFRQAGFKEVERRSETRPIMRKVL